MTYRAKYAILFIGFASVCLSVAGMAYFFSWAVGALAAFVVLVTYLRNAIDIGAIGRTEIIDGDKAYERSANRKG